MEKIINSKEKKVSSKYLFFWKKNSREANFVDAPCIFSCRDGRSITIGTFSSPGDDHGKAGLLLDYSNRIRRQTFDLGVGCREAPLSPTKSVPD